MRISKRWLTINIVLIDTWWNVNEYTKDQLKYTGEVLIDTWWNVNVIKRRIFYENYLVLIDTWWNVNSFRQVLPALCSRF